MRQTWKWLVLFVLVLGLGLNAKTPAVRPDPGGAKKKADLTRRARKKSQAAELIKLLEQLITLDKGIDANTPLKDALEFLSETYKITILVDTEAFKEEGTDCDSVEVEAAPVNLPRMKNVSLKTALRLLLSKVPPKGATFLVRGDYILITTHHKAAPGLMLQEKVMGQFDQVPLEEAVEQLANAVGASVLIDPRTEENAAAKVTATFKNDVSLETAVTLLADMAGLKVVRVGGALYVTTRENAAKFRAEDKRTP